MICDSVSRGLRSFHLPGPTCRTSYPFHITSLSNSLTSHQLPRQLTGSPPRNAESIGCTPDSASANQFVSKHLSRHLAVANKTKVASCQKDFAGPALLSSKKFAGGEAASVYCALAREGWRKSLRSSADPCHLLPDPPGKPPLPGHHGRLGSNAGCQAALSGFFAEAWNHLAVQTVVSSKGSFSRALEKSS